LGIFGLQACLCYTVSCKYPHEIDRHASMSLFVWLVADGWCWFVLREKYCWLVAGGWFVMREKYCWLVAKRTGRLSFAEICVHAYSDHSILSLPTRGARARYGSYKPRSNVASICLRNILQYLLLEKETFPPHCFRFAFVHTPPSGRSNARWFMQIHTPDQYQISLFR
jgi:hypothetical protein